MSEEQLEEQVARLVKTDREKILAKLSFHLGVDTKTLEGYLDSKDFQPNKETEQGE